MSSKPLVSILTATTGNDLLIDTLKSVNNQTYTNIQHLIFVDGEERREKTQKILDQVEVRDGVRRDVVYLPYSIGKDRWNGHRIYGAGTFVSDGDYLMFLDDDNFMQPNHIETCMATIGEKPWTFSLRRIVDKDRNFICNDDCESLGMWPSVLNDEDYFVDVNCFFVSRYVATTILPVWYRKFREPGVMEIDRAIMKVLRTYFIDYECTREYSINYTVGNTENSVKVS